MSKNHPKKLAAYLELNKQELKYILNGIAALNKIYSPSRDYSAEDLHDKLKVKLDNALVLLE